VTSGVALTGRRDLAQVFVVDGSPEVTPASVACAPLTGTPRQNGRRRSGPVGTRSRAMAKTSAPTRKVSTPCACNCPSPTPPRAASRIPSMVAMRNPASTAGRIRVQHHAGLGLTEPLNNGSPQRSTGYSVDAGQIFAALAEFADQTNAPARFTGFHDHPLRRRPNAVDRRHCASERREMSADLLTRIALDRRKVEPILIASVSIVAEVPAKPCSRNTLTTASRACSLSNSFGLAIERSRGRAPDGWVLDSLTYPALTGVPERTVRNSFGIRPAKLRSLAERVIPNRGLRNRDYAIPYCTYPNRTSVYRTLWIRINKSIALMAE